MLAHSNHPLKTLHITRLVRSESPTAKSKFLRLLEAAALLGVLDGLQAKYMTIGNWGEDEAIAYQVVFMMAAAGASYLLLFDANGTHFKNFSNLVLTIPVATLADNVSIDVQTLHPYLVLIPKAGYLWRSDVFGHTFLSQVSFWVNQQFFVPGLINGYVLAIAILASYFVVQHLLNMARP